MRFVLVTGTSTEVGKTIASAALVVVLQKQGFDVAFVKPVQTGTTDPAPTDVDTVRTLTGCHRVSELVTLPDPLAPDTAARLRSQPIPGIGDLARQCIDAGRGSDLVVVEGSGGVLVRLDTAGGTLVDLGAHLTAAGHEVQFVIVTALTLGTLNHTELTLMALRAAGGRVAGLVIGSSPAEPDLAERCNIDELPRVTGLPFLGAIPEGAGLRTPVDFRVSAPEWVGAAAGLLSA